MHPYPIIITIVIIYVPLPYLTMIIHLYLHYITDPRDRDNLVHLLSQQDNMPKNSLNKPINENQTGPKRGPKKKLIPFQSDCFMFKHVIVADHISSGILSSQLSAQPVNISYQRTLLIYPLISPSSSSSSSSSFITITITSSHRPIEQQQQPQQRSAS